jgi:hypothetical protein
MESRLIAKLEVVKDYFRLFVNRRAHTMQSMRPNPESGKHYYFRPTGKGGVPPILTQETIRKHLEGEITVALYAINPSTQRCRWVAIDADYKHAMEDLVKLEYYLKQDQVEPALEMSKRGGHLWVFLDTPLLARDCRVYIYNLALRLGVPVKGAGLAEGIEIFPKHDQLRPGEFGNAIRGPMGIHRGANRRYWFYGAEYSLEDQMAYLKRLKKVTEQEMQQFIAGKTMPAEVGGRQSGTQSPIPYSEPRPGEFRILDHISAKLRKVGRNYVTRCPSCAAASHDQCGDNLAIRIDDPRFYKCWAGCTKEMIREALGCPIRFRQTA